MLIILYIFRVAQKAFGLYTTLTMLYVYRKKQVYLNLYRTCSNSTTHLPHWEDSSNAHNCFWLLKKYQNCWKISNLLQCSSKLENHLIISLFNQTQSIWYQIQPEKKIDLCLSFSSLTQILITSNSKVKKILHMAPEVLAQSQWTPLLLCQVEKTYWGERGFLFSFWWLGNKRREEGGRDKEYQSKSCL